MDYRLFRNSSVFFSIQTLLTIIHSQQVVPQTYNSWIVFPSENSVHDSLSSCKIGLWRPKVVLVHSAPKKLPRKATLLEKKIFKLSSSEVDCTERWFFKTLILASTLITITGTHICYCTVFPFFEHFDGGSNF